MPDERPQQLSDIHSKPPSKEEKQTIEEVNDIADDLAAVHLTPKMKKDRQKFFENNYLGWLKRLQDNANSESGHVSNAAIFRLMDEFTGKPAAQPPREDDDNTPSVIKVNPT
jgi:hypothetical protein